MEDIKYIATGMTLQTNAWEINVHHQGLLKSYGGVWYGNQAITNILCLNNVKMKYRVTYDSTKGDVFVVHKDTHCIHFVCSNNGLYYHDVNNRQISLLNAVSESLTVFSEQQITKAKKQGTYMQWLDTQQ